MATLLGELGYPATAAELPSRLERMEREGRSAVFIATQGDEVTGLTTVHTFAAIHAASSVALLTALVVRETARGTGVGRRLLAAAEDWARANGCGRIMVTTAEHRAGAHLFYQRMGWEYTGRRYAKPLPER